ncbi:hypothetical protein NHQ30_005017 [Ciborinia camelliae]|nr:hypothetical protein NHQ30_005017 [Ciborinia camelliae]
MNHCGQIPYSWMVHSCGPEDTCDQVYQVNFSVDDFCPDCFMLPDPSKGPGRLLVPKKLVDSDLIDFELCEFELSRWSDNRYRTKANVILQRCNNFFDAKIDDFNRENLFLFSPSTTTSPRLNLDVYHHLHYIVYGLLMTEFWYSQDLLMDKFKEKDRQMLLQLRQVLLENLAFFEIEKSMVNEDGDGEFRKAIGAQRRWLKTIIPEPDDEPCEICGYSLEVDTAVSLPCNHAFHDDCLKNFKCPTCGEDARGPLPDISVPKYGPPPSWLDQIAPLYRGIAGGKYRPSFPMQDDQIQRLERARQHAEEKVKDRFAAVRRNQEPLNKFRRDIRAQESYQGEDLEYFAVAPDVVRNIYKLMDIRENLWALESEHEKLLLDAYNTSPVIPHIFRARQWDELECARKLFHLRRTEQETEKALAVENLLFRKNMTSEARLALYREERHLEKALEDSEFRWRDSVAVFFDLECSYKVQLLHRIYVLGRP